MWSWQSFGCNDNSEDNRFISSKADVHMQNQATNGQLHEKALPNGIAATTEVSGVDVKDNINTFNLSLVIAVGLEYSLGGSTSVLAAITFDNGFLDVLSDDNQKAISNCLGLTVGVLF